MAPLPNLCGVRPRRGSSGAATRHHWPGALHAGRMVRAGAATAAFNPRLPGFSPSNRVPVWNASLHPSALFCAPCRCGRVRAWSCAARRHGGIAPWHWLVITGEAPPGVDRGIPVTDHHSRALGTGAPLHGEAFGPEVLDAGGAVVPPMSRPACRSGMIHAHSGRRTERRQRRSSLPTPLPPRPPAGHPPTRFSLSTPRARTRAMPSSPARPHAPGKTAAAASAARHDLARHDLVCVGLGRRTGASKVTARALCLILMVRLVGRTHGRRKRLRPCCCLLHRRPDVAASLCPVAPA